MRTIKICFIGLGSIAKRHIKNIQKIFDQNHEELSIDIYRSGKGILEYDDIKQLINICYYNFNEVPSDYDVIFITNPTKYHYETLKEFHNKGKHFFIEKPVFDNSNIDLSDLILRENSIYYVACPLRYTEVISYIKKQLDLSNVYSVRSISSSYLPDWRPGQDYRKTYSAKKELGGGVSIDLIHEWDYIQYLFGFPTNVSSFIKRVSNLEINCDDLAVYIAEYSNKVVELHLDYFGRFPIRKLEIYNDNETIIGDLIHNKIQYLKSGEEIYFGESRDDYQIKELKAFFSLIKGDLHHENNEIETACKVLSLCKGEIRK